MVGLPFPLHCNKRISLISARILSCHLGKLVYVAVACCKQSGNDSLSGFGELVTVSAGDLLEDSVRP
jgi:hypothetical protein